MAVRNRLKVILAEKNISQNELADAINVGKSTMSNIIKGKQNATLEAALDIANFLNMPVERIFYKELEDKDVTPEEDFEEMMENCDELFILYEKNVLNESHLINLYREFIGNFNKKYDPFIFDMCVDSYINKGKLFNRVVSDVIHGVE